jgi:hypothetical protein
MNVFTVIGIVGLSVALLGLGLAKLMYSLSRAITVAYAEAEDEKKKFRPAATMGYRIAPTDAPDTQFKQAREEAAKRAAAQPRGGNMGVGKGGSLQTASKKLAQDPVSAFKIAQVQGWTGLGEMDKYQSAAASAPTAAPSAAGPRVKKKLVPGQDYPVTNITAGMDPAEVRRIRIANAKAKAAAMKALKASGADTVAAPATAGAPSAPKAPKVTAASVGVAEPQLIPITDDMDPADLRKARIANSKAMSTYKKALKAAGVSLDDDEPVEEAAPAPVAQAPAAVASSGPSSADLAGIPKPDLIAITDGMDPNDLRKARISNSKAVSAYKKALKEAGIDPSTVEI